MAKYNYHKDHTEPKQAGMVFVFGSNLGAPRSAGGRGSAMALASANFADPHITAAVLQNSQKISTGLRARSQKA